MLDSLPFSFYDLIALGVILLAGIFCAFWGLAGVVARLGAWSGAVIVALTAFPHLRGFAGQYISPPLLADIATIAAVFAASLALFLMLGNMIAGVIRKSALGPIDRALGFALGLSFGFALVSLGVLGFHMLVEEDGVPQDLAESRSYELMLQSGIGLSSLMPEQFVTPQLEKLQQGLSDYQKLREAGQLYDRYVNPTPSAGTNENTTSQGLPNGGQQGYSDEVRDQLDDLFQATQ